MVQIRSQTTVGLCADFQMRGDNLPMSQTIRVMCDAALNLSRPYVIKLL